MRFRPVLLCSFLLVRLAGLASGNTGPPAPPAGPGPSLVWNARPAEPRDIVLLARWRNPEATLAAVQAIVPMLQVRAGIVSALGPAGAALALGAPVDLLVALGPDEGGQPASPMVAIAVGISSVEAARKAVREQFQGHWSELHKGVWAVRFQAGASREVHCLLGSPPAASPLRMACGLQPRDVNALGSYLIRALPQQDLGGGDLHVELRFQPAHRRYAEQVRGALRMVATVVPQKLQLGHPGFDRLVTDAVQGLVREIEAVGGDLDRAVVDLSLGADGVDLRVSSRLSGRTSWWARGWQSMARRALPASELMFRLPRDSRAASFGPGMNPQDLAPIQTTLADLLGAFLEHHGLPAGERRRVQDLIRLNWTVRTYVLCRGRSDLSSGPATRSAPARPLLEEYWLGGFDGPPEPLRSWLREVVAVYNRPPVQALLRRTLAKHLALPAFQPLPPQRELPQGSQGIRVTLRLPGQEGTRGSKVQPAPVTLYLLLVPDGERSWLGAGGHLPTLLRRLRGQLRTVEADTLAQRQGLEALRQGAHLFGGYWTVADLVETIESTLARRDQPPAKPVAQLLGLAPHHGETPMVYFGDVVDSGALLEGSLTACVPRSSLEDVLSIVLGLQGTMLRP